MRKNLSRRIAALAAFCIIWAGTAWTGFADLRILEEADGERMETLFKGNRISSQLDVGIRSVLFCESGELLVISSARGGRYWQGDIATYHEELNAMFDFGLEAIRDLDLSDVGDLEGLGDISALFGELFGGESQAGDVRVRVTKAGEETVAGYAAERYVVETGSGNDWRVYEEVWISQDLLAEVAAEAAACVGFMAEVIGGISSAVGAFGMDEMEAVLASPEYQALMERGYPVRTREYMPGFFGETLEWSTEVIEVNREPIPEDAFSVPSGYRRVNSFFEVFDL